jgi:hypothetical protein
MAREQLICSFTLDAQIKQYLALLSDEANLSRSCYLRQLIKETYERKKQKRLEREDKKFRQYDELLERIEGK